MFIKWFWLAAGMAVTLQLEAQQLPGSFSPRYHFSNPRPWSAGEAATPATRKHLKGWVYIDTITFQPESADGYDSVVYLTKSYRTAPFFVYPAEISNNEYRLFLAQSKDNSSGPDTSLWESEMNNPVYAAYYFQHPAYGSYPVCGVSYHQALRYCKWLEDSLNRKYSGKLPGMRLSVDLPSEAQWQAMYEFSIRRNAGKTTPGFVQPSYLRFTIGPSGYRANFGRMISERGANLARKPVTGPQPAFGAPMTVQGLPASGGIRMLLGNVAEWTSTDADSALFNNKEFIYTVSGRLAPNVYERMDSNVLATYLRKPEQQRKYSVIKGGSWNDDIFFLQPAATRLMSRSSASCSVGFRPVITLVKTGK